MSAESVKGVPEEGRQHRHECVENPHGDDGERCHQRGFHLCNCGATAAALDTGSGEWIKSHATEGWPGEQFGMSRFA